MTRPFSVSSTSTVKGARSVAPKAHAASVAVNASAVAETDAVVVQTVFPARSLIAARTLTSADVGRRFAINAPTGSDSFSKTV